MKNKSTQREVWSLLSATKRRSLDPWNILPLGECLCPGALATSQSKNVILWWWLWLSSVQFSRSVVSDSLRPHELQHARPPCSSLTPGVYSNSCLLSWWCHPTISSSVDLFSCPHALPASGSFPMNQLFSSGGQIIGGSASASVLPVNTQEWPPLGFGSHGSNSVRGKDWRLKVNRAGSMWFEPQ